MATFLLDFTGFSPKGCKVHSLDRPSMQQLLRNYTVYYLFKKLTYALGPSVFCHFIKDGLGLGR